MQIHKLAASPEWAALWASAPVEVKRAELLRQLRSTSARDPYTLGRLQGALDALDWLEALPERTLVIEQRRKSLAEPLPAEVQ